MGQNVTANLRTVALVGHGAAGKTTLAESLLAATGAIASRGMVEKGNTVCDFDPQEKELGHSLNSAMVSFGWLGTQIHLIDTPGYPDFAGQAIGALAGVDTALIPLNRLLVLAAVAIALSEVVHVARVLRLGLQTLLEELDIPLELIHTV